MINPMNPPYAVFVLGMSELHAHMVRLHMKAGEPNTHGTFCMVIRQSYLDLLDHLMRGRYVVDYRDVVVTLDEASDERVAVSLQIDCTTFPIWRAPAQTFRAIFEPYEGGMRCEHVYGGVTARI